MNRPMTQDLAQGEGPTLEEGDTVEVEFTGWLLGNGKLGKVFDGNSDKEKGLRFRLGKGKVLKGWEKGVLGMRKDGQRLILVPSSLGYGERGLAGHVPPNANLAFNILIKRVLHASWASFYSCTSLQWQNLDP
uniref:peptidylprolyl isomerase n=1 Tax=Eptatretus burgeri TaxID=7764 RepID=A0A8C4QE98_EPTBU